MTEFATPTTPRVLVLCTGNLCRSPIVEALLRRELEAHGIEATVSSAGLAAPDGRVPDRRLHQVAEELGVDVSGHRSQMVSARDLAEADLILTMTAEQSHQARTLVPSTAGRMLTLRTAALRAPILAGRPRRFGAWVEHLTRDSDGSADRAGDIADPIGGPLREYRAMGAEVSSLVDALVDHWGGR